MKPKYIKQLLLSLSLFVVGLNATAEDSHICSETTITFPDFAFPKKVIKNANAELKKSLAEGNDVGAMRALLNLIVARGITDSESLPETYRTISESRLKISSPGAKALTYLLQAKILSQIYHQIDYSIKDQELPLTPLPADWNEWSDSQFQMEINRLVSNALRDKKSLANEDISVYTPLIIQSDQIHTYYPHLFDFISYQAIKILSDTYSPFRNVPASLIEKIPTADTTPLSVYQDSIQSKILGLYSDLMRTNKNCYAPYLHAYVECAKFIGNNVFYQQEARKDCLSHDLITSLYNEYFPLTEYAGDILIDGYSNLSYSQDDQKDMKRPMFQLAKDFIKRYPEFWRIGNIKQIANDIAQPKVSFSLNACAAPGVPFTVNVSIENTDEIYIKIFQLKKTESAKSENWDLASDRPIVVQKIGQTGTIPYEYYERIKLVVPEPGMYYIFASLNQDDIPAKGNIKTSNFYSTDSKFNGTILKCYSTGIASILDSEYNLFSFNPLTGKPKGNVEIFLNPDTAVHVGTTDQNGFLRLPADEKWPKKHKFIPREGEDINGSIYIVGSGPPKSSYDLTYKNTTFTDLPIYHPGDTVRWETIIYQNSPNKSENHTLNNVRIRTFLLNKNEIAIDSTEVISDNLGRCFGSFNIPKNELTGTYLLQFDLVEDGIENNQCRLRSHEIMVSDYKMPTFMIENVQPQINKPADGDVTVEGRVVSYSGVGLADTEIKLSAHPMTYHSGYYAPQESYFFADTIKTSHNGFFSITIPADAFVNSAYPDGRFQCQIIATSTAGESQTAKIVASRKKSYLIKAGFTNSISPNLVFDKNLPVEVDIEVKDVNNKLVNTMVRLSIQDFFGEEKYSTLLPVGESKIDLKSLVSYNDYSFNFSIADHEIDAKTTTIPDVTLFDPNGKESPSLSSIWGCNPISNTHLKRGEKASFYYAVPEDDTYFIYMLTSEEKVLESRWMKANAGVHQMSVSLPDGAEQACVRLLSFKNFSNTSATFELKLEENELKLECESFRNKLIPTERETWKFRVVDRSGKPMRAGVVMTMYNEALNTLKSLNYNKAFQQRYIPPFYFNIYGSLNYQRFNAAFSPENYLLYNRNELTNYLIPDAAFNTFGHPLVSYDYVCSWFEEDDDVYIAHGIGSPPRPKETDPEVFQYRKSNIPAAFFQPALTTNENGSLEYSFSVPNANTTWRLNVFAFTDSLLSTSMTRTFIASKPIMVSPNLPRFLRVGDQADITALVINNSDKVQVVKTQCQLLNMSTKRFIHHSESIDTIKPGGTCPVTITVNIPDNTPFISVRFKSSAELFSDGEQSLIEILPASQPVIEIKPFYVSPDSTQVKISVPNFNISENSRVTLEYWQDPMWYIITSLPGLQSNKISTSIEAANAIFSASVADGLMHEYPVISKVLSQWIERDKSDSTLVSLLQRNPDIKTMLLQATPWMVDAMSQSVQIQRLSLLFSKSEIDSNISNAIDQLRKCQQNDGGWAWLPSGEASSIWATSSILLNLGHLSRIGYLPADKSLRDMIYKSLDWYEREFPNQSEDSSLRNSLIYLTIFDQWFDFTPSKTSKKYIQNAITQIEKNWRNLSISEKADAALILAHNGKMKLAKTIMQSIYEYAKSTPEQGMWWPSSANLSTSTKVLNATKEIFPGSPMINSILQWLILQKETRDFGSAPLASKVIYSILNVLPKSIESLELSSEPLIGFIKDDLTEYVSFTLFASYFVSEITKADSTKQYDVTSSIDFNKYAGLPAWGAFYHQSIKQLSDIESAGCESLTINKKIYRQEKDRWIESDSLNVGDKVRIVLTIHANRDIDYVTVTDNRAACLEPVEQLPAPIYSQGICFYRENRDSATNIFITNLSKGVYTIEYEMWVNNAGKFSSGIATIQSQYAPQYSAHSSGRLLNVISH